MPVLFVIQLLSHVQLFAALQAPLSSAISQSLLRFMSIEPVMLSNHLILCRPLLLPSIFPSIRVFSHESALHIRWPKYWSFSFSIDPSNEYSGLISFRTDWLDLLTYMPSIGIWTKVLGTTLAWKIPWMEEPGRLQSIRSQRVRHDWAPSLSLFTFMHWRRNWQPTPVFLPGESQGRGSLVGCRLWGRTELDTTDAT